jgi:hypothetical protein
MERNRRFENVDDCKPEGSAIAGVVGFFCAQTRLEEIIPRMIRVALNR